MRRSSLIIALMVVPTVLVSPAVAKSFIQPNDRVVFLGDSITAQNLYTKYIEQYYTAVHPEWKVTFVNAGVGGDTSSGAVNRVQKDVIDRNPTVVTICFAMNDAGYKPAVDPERLRKFGEGIRQLIATIQERTKARIVLLTTTCVDPRKNTNLTGYNETLLAFVDETKKIAKERKLMVVDLHHPMLDSLNRGQDGDSNSFTLIPDAVHPNEPGHLLMALTILKVWGEKL